MPVGTDSLQRMAKQNFGLDFPGALRVATGIEKDPNGIAQQLFGKDLYGASDDLFTELGGRALVLNGTSGTFVSTPDAAALDIAGDIDIRIELEINTVATHNLISKWNTTGNQRAYLLRYVAAFALYQFAHSTNGTTDIPTGSSATFLVPFGRAIKFTLDANNGSSQRVGRFYEDIPTFSDSNIIATTLRHTETVSGVATIFNSTAPLRIGAGNAGTDNPLNGRIFRMQLRNGIDGTLVANPDFRFLTPGTTSFQDSLGVTWTLNGSAVIA
jgi:hypothetical protein